ncbi:MAG: hypothetical protein JW927_08570 [Deltaproteobacteria bacterium]|nr:hypothetical protein [Deltaproteobacteria bacterium]
MKLQRLGGIAAIAGTCLYILYRLLYLFIQARFGELDEPAKVINAVAAAPADFYVLNLIYIAANILGIIFFYALYERLKENAPHLSGIMLKTAFVGTAFYIAGSMIYIKAISMIAPAKDASAYRAIDAAVAGMNSFGDHTWGWVYLLIGCTVLKTKAFSPIPGWLSVVVGIFWIPWFILSQFGFDMIGLFSLLPFIISTIWLGIELLRQKHSYLTAAVPHTSV